MRVAFILGNYPPEQRKIREEAAKSYEAPGLEVGVISIPFTPFEGITPAEMQQAAPYFHAAFCQAEDEGYDAAVPLGMLNLGVEGARSLVDIPVIAPFEAALLVAAQLGDRSGIVCYTEEGIPKARMHARLYGLESKVGGYDTSGVVLHEMSDRKTQMIDTFLSAARRLIDQQGVDVIIPGGITQCPVLMKPDWLSEQLGVPVVEGIGAPIRMAALLAGLGLKHSRKRWQKSASRPKYERGVS